MFYVYMHTYRNQNFEFYMCAYRHKMDKRIELVVTFYVCAHTHKEIKKNIFLGEKRDPSERNANSNLRNLTHITKNRLMSIHFSPTRSKKSQPYCKK